MAAIPPIVGEVLRPVNTTIQTIGNIAADFFGTIRAGIDAISGHGHAQQMQRLANERENIQRTAETARQDINRQVALARNTALNEREIALIRENAAIRIAEINAATRALQINADERFLNQLVGICERRAGDIMIERSVHGDQVTTRIAFRPSANEISNVTQPISQQVSQAAIEYVPDTDSNSDHELELAIESSLLERIHYDLQQQRSLEHSQYQNRSSEQDELTLALRISSDEAIDREFQGMQTAINRSLDDIREKRRKQRERQLRAQQPTYITTSGSMSLYGSGRPRSPEPSLAEQIAIQESFNLNKPQFGKN